MQENWSLGKRKSSAVGILGKVDKKDVSKAEVVVQEDEERKDRPRSLSLF